MVIATRYVSLGSILAAGTLPVWLWLLHDNRNQPLLLTAALGGLLIILMHHANIKRLLAGTENKLK
ncbi:MAG: glycerol-3-phosphate acyltransferase [Pyrinomonadaceae bacterium]